MTNDQIIALAPHVAWPIAALLGILMLLPFLSRLTSAVADAKAILDKSGDIPDLVKMTKELLENTSQLKAISELTLASKSPPQVKEGDLDPLWERLEQSWKELREDVRRAASSNAVSIKFHSAAGVREGVSAMAQQGAITEKGADTIFDLWNKYQWMTKTTTPPAEFLNANVVGSFEQTAKALRASLLKAR